MNPLLAISDAGPKSMATHSLHVLKALVDHSSRRPESVAVREIGARDPNNQTLTYSELVKASSALARILADSVKPGDVVMLVAGNGVNYVAWFCAALMAGVRLFPVHCGSTAAELHACAERSGAVAIIAPGNVEAAAALRIHRFSLILAAHGPGEASTPDFAETPGAILLQSSGTTGMPKIALREGPALDAVAMNVVEAEQLTPEDRVLAAVPLSHAYGVDVLLATLLAGAALHVAPAFDAPVVADQLAETVSVFPGVPFMFEALARMTPPRPPKRLRLAFSAGTALPMRVFDSFSAAWCCPIGQLYGATELGSVTFNHPSSALFSRESIGTPMTGVSIRILDPEDSTRLLPINQCGHIAIAAPSMLAGYLSDETPTTDGHFLTGDLGFLDEHGRLFVNGRLKLLIDVGGLKVNPLEVEAALNAHPDVAECVVTPLHVSDVVTRIRAAFVPHDASHPPQQDELRRFLKQRLSTHKIPRVIDCVQSLPRLPSGKIQRNLAGNS